uniref:SprT-like domain-containing protein n=1 Tax=Bracon brevicornis TaxID=1563983 RepID=A0A6V7L439_9HYME
MENVKANEKLRKTIKKQIKIKKQQNKFECENSSKNRQSLRLRSKNNPPNDNVPALFKHNLGITHEIELPADFDFENATIIDEAFEADNPPDILEMFKQFNRKFFGGIIKFRVENSVYLKSHWSLTDLSGQVIKISKSMHKNQRRGVVVGTLLREMIHAYLWYQSVPLARNRKNCEEYLNEVRRVEKMAGCSIDIKPTKPMGLPLYKFECVLCGENSVRRINQAPNHTHPAFDRHERECGGEYLLTVLES